ncbi:MAG: thermonuclease family protein [Beijerinckiaceae bacterium]
MSRRRSVFLSSVLVLAVSAGLLYVFKGVPQKELTGVATAIDGDSLRLGSEEMRLKGIDAPEFTQTCEVSGREVSCGRESRAALRRFLQSGLVTCIGDERDRYGRLLVICRVRGMDINASMVREGHAVSFGAYEQEEEQAKRSYAGLWAGQFERPRAWRARKGLSQP